MLISQIPNVRTRARYACMHTSQAASWTGSESVLTFIAASNVGFRVYRTRFRVVSCYVRSRVIKMAAPSRVFSSTVATRVSSTQALQNPNHTQLINYNQR